MNRIEIMVILALFSLLAVACSAQPTPNVVEVVVTATPQPSATPNLDATIDARVAAAMATSPPPPR